MLLTRYAKWLHTGWPAGTAEKLPVVNTDGTTRVAGLRVVGDLGGIPLLKVAADTGARAVQAIVAERSFARGKAEHDLIIVGGGVSGISAALEAKRADLTFLVLESARPFATIHDFPTGKLIFTYPTEMKPAGSLALTADVRESLLADLEAQRTHAGISPTQASVDRVVRNGDVLEVHAGKEVFRASRVIVAIGRSGNFRELGCEGETLDKVTHRLHDPADHASQRVLVVGGGDSALEAAIALDKAGARVTLAYRG
ncbi:MAG: NAD(P)-binding domain-containing protein, partial [Polyangia bacterium]